MKIASIDPSSPLFGHVRPGYRVVTINGAPVEDEIDFRFRTTDEKVELEIEGPSGEGAVYRFELGSGDDLGLAFEEPRVKVCKCNCIFCFIRQQPRGMRPALYIKDEDYRLSFTHGNFVTLSNTTEADLERIVRQRLSPMYISVHATDTTLRRCMLGNDKLEPIIPSLKYLADNGIQIHTQVVLCPEVNDGDPLDRTIVELAALHPGVQSLAVVPVGLTRYRENLAELRGYTVAEAGEMIDRVTGYQNRFKEELGTRFVWPADEFYVLAGRELPSLSEYEEMPQFENGIGMLREFLTGFNRRKRHLKNLKSDRRVLFLTGYSAHPFLQSNIMPYLTDTLALNVDLQPVTNRFWGETVTVSGLLTGQDLLRAARGREKEFDTVVLPPNCLNNDDLFLDNLPLSQFRDALKKNVVVGSYNLAETIREVFA
jgi:putative radical SAM enzyme (TIGR03279 family)